MEDIIRDFSGRIIGRVETDGNGNQTVRSFYGEIVGRYDAQRDVTTDFYGKILARGNIAVGLLYRN